MAISLVQKDKMTEKEENQKPCEIIVGDDTHDGVFERCPRTGDLRVCCEDTGGFGDNVKSIPSGQPVTIRLKDGTNGEYTGQFDDNGKLTR